MKKLSEFLNEKYINLDLRAKNKDEVLEELTNLICDETLNKEEFLKKLKEREMMGSTSFEYGLAIPHIRTNTIKNFIVGVGISKEGIYFDSSENKKSYIFFVIATNDKYNDYHIETLANVVKLVNSEKVVDVLINTKSKEGFIDIVRKLEEI